MALEFRKLKKKDALLFKDWGKHVDIRFYQYHFPYTMDGEFIYWYHMKQGFLFHKIYGLFLDGKPVGFVTLKHIKWLKKSAELGIAVDPKFVGMGYGTLMMQYFLNHVFSHFPIDKMYLRVAEFNTRAQTSYQKAGFKTVYKKLEAYEEQSYKHEIMHLHPDQFVMRHGILYTHFITMSIDKASFMASLDSTTTD